MAQEPASRVTATADLSIRRVWAAVGPLFERLRGLLLRPWSVYALLLAFGMTLVLPMVLLSAALLRNQDRVERQRIEQRVARSALEVARDLERELAGLRTTLEVMAASPTLASGNLTEFRQFAASAAEKQRVNIVLRDPSGQQLFNTRDVEVAGLSGIAIPPDDWKAIVNGRRHVTNVFIGINRKLPIFIISVPVTTGRYNGHLLNAVIQPEALAQQLNLADVASGIAIRILDRRGTVVVQGAGIVDDEIDGIADIMSDRTQDKHGVRRGHSKQAGPLLVGYQRSELSGWLILSVLPLRNHETTASRHYQFLVFQSLALILASIALAFWFGRTIATPVSLLAERANHLEQERIEPAPRVRVQEVGEVMKRLDEAAARLKSSTQEVRLSEMRYRQLAVFTPSGLFRTDNDGRHTFVNGRWCAITGGEAEAALGLSWLEAIHPHDRADVAAAWRQARDSGGTMQVECRIARPEGRAPWVLCEMSAEFDDEGRRIGAVGALTDLTERKAAENVRRESENRLRLALELGRMGTFTWSLAAGRIELDAIGAAMLGLPTVNHVRGLVELLAHASEADRPRIARYEADLLGAAEARGLELRVARPSDGAHRYIAVRAFRQAGTSTPTGSPGRVIGVLFDITEQSLAAQSLEEMNADLERRVGERTRELAAANERLTTEMREREAVQAALSQAQKLEALGQLTSSVAHDFNNQLMAVLGGLELIEKAATEPRLRRHAQNARSAARRASQLTDQLLSFARRSQLAPGRIDIAQSFAELDDVLRHAVGPRVQRRIEIASDVAAAWADPVQLHATLVNIAINARDAMPKGGELLIAARNVEVTPAEASVDLAPGRYVAISLTDNGSGMSDEVRQRAGEPFFTTKPRGRGTGLGLAMAHRFVEQSSGRLRIESRLGAGTTVELLLPVAKAEPVPAVTGIEPRALEALEHDRVLCVDDDRLSAEVTAEMLRNLGYEVTMCTDPMAALASASAMAGFDLLVTDIDMPEMDGFALADRLRRQNPHMSVLYVTGHNEHMQRLGGGQTNHVLAKPFTTNDLRLRLQALETESARDRAEQPARTEVGAGVK